MTFVPCCLIQTEVRASRDSGGIIFLAQKAIRALFRASA